MRRLAFAIWLMACTGSTPPEIDANPNGPRCNGNDYDLCQEEHDCTSMLCQTFAEGFTVCTVACGSACPPDKTGAAGVCDPVTSVCKPSAPNMCHLGP
jgi:hypothetical protein